MLLWALKGEAKKLTPTKQYEHAVPGPQWLPGKPWIRSRSVVPVLFGNDVRGKACRSLRKCRDSGLHHVLACSAIAGGVDVHRVGKENVAKLVGVRRWDDGCIRTYCMKPIG